MQNAGKVPTDQLDFAIDSMCRKTRDLRYFFLLVTFASFFKPFHFKNRRQLRKAVVDHVSDSFLEPETPLLMLITAAREGREKEVSFPSLDLN
jgi:catenin alpha